jgi:hypothetical protein
VSELLQRVERFLFHEANLLDESRFEEWLGLFEPDAYYWMPIERGETRRAHVLCTSTTIGPSSSSGPAAARAECAHRVAAASRAAISNVVIEDAATASCARSSSCTSSGVAISAATTTGSSAAPSGTR